MKLILKSTVMSFVLIGILSIYSISLKSIVPHEMACGAKIENILYSMGAPENDVPEIANAIIMASRQTGVSENLIIALMATESNFNKNALSVSGYSGLMQIPRQYTQYGGIKYIDINVLIGARIFKEKLYITGGDVHRAIILYKGWRPTDEKGIVNANRVMRIYTNINNRT